MRSMRVARLRVPVLLLVMTARAAADPWVCHTIDDSSQGADGVRLADVNGDGLMDLTVGWEEGGVVRAYRHPGRGKEGNRWPSVTVGQVRSPEDAVFVDLDGDGAVDVVSSCEGRTRTMFVHWGPEDPESWTATEGWQTEAIPATASKQSWMYALPMQVDGRHGVDVITGSKGGNGSVGWLQAPKEARDLTGWQWRQLEEAGWIMSLIAADMDGDGDQDVLVSDRKGARRGVYWLEHPGSEQAAAGAEWMRHDIGGRDREIMFLSRGDVDQDGRPDVVGIDAKSVVWFRETEAGWSEQVVALPEGVGTGKSVAVGDVDGDGRHDLVFSCEHATGELSGMRWLSWNGSPRDEEWTSHEIAGAPGVKYDRVVLHDVDGDGDLDVLCCEERDQLGVFWYENPSRPQGEQEEEQRQAAGGRPNVLLIMADDLGLECLGCYGGTSYRTPHLDALAAGGLRFTNCFSTPKCSPSRVTLLTGRYTFRTTNEWGFIPPGERTFGHCLQEAGYDTALAGKWQLGRIVDDPGMIPRFGFADYCAWGWHEGPRYWRPCIWEDGQLRGDVKERYGPEVFTEFLAEFMTRRRDKPFLAYYPMVLTHFPKGDEPKGPTGGWETFEEMVEEMDRRVGRLIEALEEAGLRESTLVLFTADNGSPTGVQSKRGGQVIRGGKAKLTDNGTRVPLLANMPGRVPVGVHDDLIDFTDFLPTLVEVGEADLPDVELDGRSFATRLWGGPGRPRSWVYTEWEGKRWVRDKNWKLYGDGRLFRMTEFSEEGSPVGPGEADAARVRLGEVMGALRNGADSAK